jgi:L-ascorbate metabolism protein UlaG (beta-lactamase superfamily)
MGISITWLGHATCLIGLPSGQRIVVDPWLTNPKCPAEWSKPEALRPAALILVTHGHRDHFEDALPVARATGAPVVCLAELGH